MKDSLHYISPILFFITLQFIKFNTIGNVNLSIIAYILFTIFTIYSSSYVFLCIRMLKREVWSKKKKLKIKSQLLIIGVNF
jgi:hypothetical protein